VARRRTVIVLVGVALATVGVYVAAFSLDTTRDRPDTLDVEPVKGAASAACARLRADLDALPPLAPGAPTPQRLDRLAVQDAAVRTLVGDVRAVGEPALRRDVPAEQWLADWMSLADARRAYADGGAAGPFHPPVADGRPLTDRMGRVGVPTCVVPLSLTIAP